jgi:hypothetical protein
MSFSTSWARPRTSSCSTTSRTFLQRRAGQISVPVLQRLAIRSAASPAVACNDWSSRCLQRQLQRFGRFGGQPQAGQHQFLIVRLGDPLHDAHGHRRRVVRSHGQTQVSLQRPFLPLPAVGRRSGPADRRQRVHPANRPTLRWRPRAWPDRRPSQPHAASPALRPPPSCPAIGSAQAECPQVHDSSCLSTAAAHRSGSASRRNAFSAASITARSLRVRGPKRPIGPSARCRRDRPKTPSAVIAAWATSAF